MISKNGNGWGIYELSDYDGSLEFRLFGEDYQKFKHLLEAGKVLFIKGGYQQSWKGDRLDFKPKEVKLLEGLGESMTKSITLSMTLDKLSEKIVHELEQLALAKPGPHRLKMVIYDHNRNLKLDLRSKARTVLADNDFVAELERMGVEYAVN